MFSVENLPGCQLEISRTLPSPFRGSDFVNFSRVQTLVITGQEIAVCEDDLGGSEKWICNAACAHMSSIVCHHEVAYMPTMLKNGCPVHDPYYPFLQPPITFDPLPSYPPTYSIYPIPFNVLPILL